MNWTKSRSFLQHYANGSSSEGLCVNSVIPSCCNRTLGACLTAFSSKIDSLWGHFGGEGSVDTCVCVFFLSCKWADVVPARLCACFQSVAAQRCVCPHEVDGRLISSQAVLFLAWLRVASVLATQDCRAAELHCSGRIQVLHMPTQSYEQQTCCHRLGCWVKEKVELKRHEASAVIHVLHLLQLLFSSVSWVSIFNVRYPFSCINFPSKLSKLQQVKS